jgi:uncharacterized protein (DUF983 family)
VNVVVVIRNAQSVIDTLWRSIRLKCPACGRSSIVLRPFHVKDKCSSCHVLFKREEGFFVGAILANLVATEGVIVSLYVLGISILSSNFQSLLRLLFIVAVVFPLVFYHHSWALWLGLDQIIEGLPKDKRR